MKTATDSKPAGAAADGCSVGGAALPPDALLAPHAKRKIRAFIIEPERGNFSDTKAFDAFWSLIYGRTVVDHATALAVEAELMMSTRTVGEVLAGWRPEALKTAAA